MDWRRACVDGPRHAPAARRGPGRPRRRLVYVKLTRWRAHAMSEWVTRKRARVNITDYSLDLETYLNSRT